MHEEEKGTLTEKERTEIKQKFPRLRDLPADQAINEFVHLMIDAGKKIEGGTSIDETLPEAEGGVSGSGVGRSSAI